MIVCASIHGHTYEAAQFLKAELEKHGEKVILRNLCHEDISEVIGDAFCYDRLVLAASSYDGGVFAPMDDFLHHLKNKNFQNRPVAYIDVYKRQVHHNPYALGICSFLINDDHPK